jgi:hypothetical protein
MGRISVTEWAERKIEALLSGQTVTLDCGVTVERSMYRWIVRREVGGATKCRSVKRAAILAVRLMNKSA